MSLRSDALLAATGIMPRDITATQTRAASVTPDRWVRRLKAWIRGEQQPFKYEAPKDLDAAFERLSAQIDEDQITGWLDGIGLDDIELGAEYLAGLTRAREYALAQWPKFSVDTLAGPKSLPLSADDAEELSSVLQVLDDPDRILDELDSRTLTASQVAAFEAAYPDLYAMANDALDRAIGDTLAKNTDWSPGYEAEAMLKALRGAPPETPYTPQAKPPEPETKFKIDADRDATQAQVTERPKGSNQK